MNSDTALIEKHENLRRNLISDLLGNKFNAKDINDQIAKLKPDFS